MTLAEIEKRVIEIAENNDGTTIPSVTSSTPWANPPLNTSDLHMIYEEEFDVQIPNPFPGTTINDVIIHIDNALNSQTDG